MPVKTYLCRHIYRWHRISSLVIALPLLLWTISGLLHPVMNSFKPAVQHTALPPVAIDTTMVKVSLCDALQQNGIRSIQSVRFVTRQNSLYYQVSQGRKGNLLYISCTDGSLLADGDRLYAIELAKRFLGEEKSNANVAAGHDHTRMAAGFTGVSAPVVNHETGSGQSRVLQALFLSFFTKDYKSSNKILPVCEVAFRRKDSIRLYVETGAGRLVLATDQTKRWFTTLFGLTHSWRFLDGMGRVKSFLMGAVSALCFLSAFSGSLVYNVLRKKKPGITTGRSWHRLLGNVFLLTTLLYAFSGAWHAFAKLPARKLMSPSATTASFSQQEIPPALPFSAVRTGESERRSLLAAIIL